MIIAPRTKYLLGFIVLLFILVLFAWELRETTARSAREREWTERAHAAIGACDLLRALIIEYNAESAVARIHPDSGRAASLDADTAEMRQLVSSLRMFTASHPEQQSILDTLDVLLEAGLAPSAPPQLADSGRNAGPEAAAASSTSGLRREALLAQIDRLKNEESGLLAERTKLAVESDASQELILSVALLLIIIFAVILYLSVRRKAATLESSAKDLELQVRERSVSLENISRLYATLSQINQCVIRARSRDELFTMVCRAAISHGRFQIAWIVLADAEHGTLVTAASHAQQQIAPPFSRVSLREPPFADDLLGSAVRTGTVKYSNDLRTDGEMAHWRGAAQKANFASAAFVPFRVHGAVEGALVLCASGTDFFEDENERRLLDELSLEISFGLDDLDSAEERKRVGRSLELLQNAVERSGEIIFMTDVSGIITYINPAFTAVYGYAASEVVGKKTPRILKSGIEPSFGYADFWKRLLARQTLHGEIMNKTKAGRLITIETSVSPILDDRGGISGFLAIQRDVTERTKAIELERQNELQLRQIIDLVPHFIFAKDGDGKFILVNAAVADAYGTTVEELTGRTDADFAKSESEARHFQSDDEEVLRTGHPKIIAEETITDAGGKVRYLSTIKTPFAFVTSGKRGILGVSVDISDRKEAEEALRKSDAQFRLISENMADMIVVLDLNGKRLYNSPSYEALLGRPASLRGTDSFHEVHPDDRERIKQIFRETVQTGYGQQTEYRLITKEGSIRFIESRGSVIRDANGKVAQVVVVSRDITERKELEKQLLRAQRIESIGTLAGGIAHDLNNVLTPVMLSLEILRKRLPDDQSQKMLQVLEATTRRGSDLVRQVLSFARGVEGEKTSVQVRHLIAEIGKIVNETFPKEITFKSKIPKSLPTVSADPTQLHQVLMNLCVNARDAMPQGGQIEVTAETVLLDEQFVLMNAGAHPGAYVVIAVSDKGVGIPQSILDRIFEPFFTTKEQGKGTGLGLSTVQAIVKSHDGFVHVNSEVGVGTTFKVFLPALEIQGIALDEERRRPPTGNGEVILVVEDEAAIREITKTTLEAYGYSVLTASDGTEAVTTYVTRGTEIALVVTDMVMPYMDGESTIRAIQKFRPDVKVLIVSGLKQRAEQLVTEHIAFLQKPYTSEALLRAIGELLHRS